MDVLKVLVVGPPKTGKTNLILSLLNENLRNSMQRDSFQGQTGPVTHSQRDFVLKILSVEEHKFRTQLWDVAGGATPDSAFAPLYIRNCAGCLIVVNSNSKKIADEAMTWKNHFDKYTQIPNSIPLPSALIVNHFSGGDISESITISPALKQLSQDLVEKHGFVGVYHVNSSTREETERSYEDFIMKVVEDQVKNQRTQDMADELWDESIKIKKRHFVNRNQQNPGPGQQLSPTSKQSMAAQRMSKREIQETNFQNPQRQTMRQTQRQDNMQRLSAKPDQYGTYDGQKKGKCCK